MIGPAATYGAALPMASQAATGDASAGYDAVTPSLATSATLGFMDPRMGHNKGLRSGGLVGYSTFFTGYDPQRDGVARQLSLGRGAAQAVSATSRALMHTGLQYTAAARYIEPFTMAHRYGIGGAMDAAIRGPTGQRASSGVAAPVRGPAYNRSGMRMAANRNSFNPALGAQGTGSPTWGRHNVRGQNATDSLRPVDRKSTLRPYSYSPRGRNKYFDPWVLNSGAIDDVKAGAGPNLSTPTVSSRSRSLREMAAKAGDNKLVLEAMDEKTDRSAAYKVITGMFGGMGYDEEGRAVGNYVEETLGSGRRYGFRSAAKGSGGAYMMKGSAGKLLGKGFKTLGYFEIANMAADAATYALGQGYEAMVETTERMQRRVGADKSMSGGYFNNTAATERQRAVQSLNENRLNPRTQVLGNEAALMH